MQAFVNYIIIFVDGCRPTVESLFFFFKTFSQRTFLLYFNILIYLSNLNPKIDLRFIFQIFEIFVSSNYQLRFQ